MKIWMLALVPAILTAVPAQEKLDDRAYTAIADIIANTKQTGEQAQRVVDALSDAAKADKAVENALVFRTVAAGLAKRGGEGGAFLLSEMSEKFSDSLWKSFVYLKDRYRPEGVLPAVRYSSIGAGAVKEWLYRFSMDFDRDGLESTLMQRYTALRGQGYRPDQAVFRILDAKNQDLDEGLMLIVRQMKAMGQWALTGYTNKDAVKDAYAFLEGRYALDNPDATDTKGIVRVVYPMSIISMRLVAALRADNSHMMVKVRQIVSRASDGPTQPSRKAPLGGPNLNGNWVESGTTNKYIIVHEGYQVSIIRVDKKGQSPAGDVVFVADLSSKRPSGDFVGKGKCYPRGGERNHYDTSPKWDWYTGGFEIKDKDYCIAEWLAGYTGSVCLRRVKSL